MQVRSRWWCADALFVPFTAMALEVVIDFSLECFEQHPPGTVAAISSNRKCSSPASLPSRFSTTFSVDNVSLPPAVALLTQKGTPPFHARIPYTTFVNNLCAGTVTVSRVLVKDVVIENKGVGDCGV